MQLDIIRQFQVQRGTVNGILEQHALEEARRAQNYEDLKLSNKYLADDLMHLETMRDDSSDDDDLGPGHIYLQEFNDDDADEY